MIYAKDRPEVLAVLDWELSTLGDPLADFTYVAMAWVTENGGRSGVEDLDRKALGIPELGEMVERYCAATGRDGVPDMNWYFARSEEHTSELQSLMRNSYAVFCLKKKKQQ